jgi:hypothetical protein
MPISIKMLRIIPYITLKPFYITLIAEVESELIKLEMFSNTFDVFNIHYIIV